MLNSSSRKLSQGHNERKSSSSQHTCNQIYISNRHNTPKSLVFLPLEEFILCNLCFASMNSEALQRRKLLKIDNYVPQIVLSSNLIAIVEMFIRNQFTKSARTMIK